MEYLYRKATREDERRIRELFIEMLRTLYHTDDVDGYEDGYLDQFFCGGENRILVAEDHGDLAAYLAIQVYRDQNYIYLDDLSVTEKYRNLGIGTKLIRDAEQYASDTGIRAVIFHVEKSNESAHRLYERLGYRDDLEEGSRIRMIKERFLPETLETERLILRPLTWRDKPSVYQWAGDPRVAKFMMYSTYRSVDDADRWLQDLYASEKDLEYGFVWKDTGELIGSGCMGYSPDEDVWHIGYNIRYDMWGKGIVTEACRKIIAFARENYDVKRIVGSFANDNPASGRVMEKLGMKFQKDCEYTKFDGSMTFKGKIYAISYRQESIMINGLGVHAAYSERAINEIFIPLLQRLADMHQRKGKRILAMLAAPPGAGKSTLLCFLEKLAGEQSGIPKVQTIGMDGFHRRQDYLVDHYTEREGRQIRMVDIKGAPVTFDLDALTESIRKVASGENCGWPVYDRTLHNPVPDAVTVDGDIIILEGNYLLLDEDGWRDLSPYADYTISITADEDLLRSRLIDRKAKTVGDRVEAIRFVDFSDMPNVRLCLAHSLPADLKLGIEDVT